MRQADDSQLDAALRSLIEQEQATRQELADRDERFAVLEAEIWAGFEVRDARQRRLIEEREQAWARARDELAAREQEVSTLRAEIGRLAQEIHQRDVTIAELTETAFGLRFRLQRILSSRPARLYAALFELPGLSLLQRWRSRRYEAALARERPS